jgi:peptidyl-prolyl cis-trans isomerase SurA
VSTQGLQAGEKENGLLKQYFESSLIGYEEAHLEEKYVDYRMLLREYREGILLFQLMDEEIWSRAASDSAGLYEFFSENRHEYREPDQYRATKFSIIDVNVQDTLAYLAANNPEGALGDLLRQYEGQGIVKSEAVVLPADSLNSQVKIGEYVSTDEGMVRVDEFVRGSLPVLPEIRGKVIADYQNYLENEWIGQLRATYNVILNEDGLEYVYEQLVR